jgi:hypothetical protein
MIVFAKTRHHYDSYTDFWALVELSGFETCYIDEIDVSQPKFYVLTPWNGEVPPHLQNEREKKRVGKIAWWCLERFDAMGVPLVEPVNEASALVDECWVSDRLTSTHDERLKYVRMGSHPDLGALPLEPRYDFTHQSYAWGRREAMYNQLKDMGLQEGPSCWGSMRHDVLRQSRLMLNLQQYPDPVTAPLRFAIAAAYHLPVVSETIADPDPVGPLIRIVGYEAIPEAVRDVVAGGMRTLAEALHEKLCVEYTFRKCVEAVV